MGEDRSSSLWWYAITGIAFGLVQSVIIYEKNRNHLIVNTSWTLFGEHFLTCDRLKVKLQFLSNSEEGNWVQLG